MATSRGYKRLRAWAGAEYPLLRFLERNGYDVSYQAGLDTHHRGLPQGTRLFISVGHDEYWSGPQRAAVEAARDAEEQRWCRTAWDCLDPMRAMGLVPDRHTSSSLVKGIDATRQPSRRDVSQPVRHADSFPSATSEP